MVEIFLVQQIFGAGKNLQERKSKPRRDPEKIIQSLVELQLNDPITHEEHGVGRYLGLQVLEIQGTENEFLVVEYLKGDRLFVPVLNLHTVSRYLGGDAETAPLHRLGSDSWRLAKERAKQQTRDVAAELLATQAIRSARKGHSFQVSTEDYANFVSGFPYVETEDQKDVMQEVLQDLESDRPMDRLVCGDVGFGKTEIARALASGLGTNLIRLQCYEGLDINQAVYEWNHTRQILEIRLMEASGEVDRESANANLFSEKFLIKRPLLQAIDDAQERPPVLLIDELDRSDEEFEGFLLELLADYQITIPELGTYKAAHPPIVIITSNRTREIHDALKRRCLYYWVDYPDYQKELQIITARIPEAPRKLAEQVTSFIQEMRETELFKIPGVSETLDWLSALLALNQTELDPGVIDDTLGMMLKYQDDIESVKGEPVRAILERSKNRGPRRGGRRRG